MASHTYKTIDAPDGEYIATADGRLTVLSDRASVERLQAHAPELLAALEALSAHVGAHDCAVCAQARAAIRKARGI